MRLVTARLYGTQIMSNFSRIKHWLQQQDDELEYDPDGREAAHAASWAPILTVPSNVTLYGPTSVSSVSVARCVSPTLSVVQQAWADDATGETPFYSIEDVDPHHD
jgi:hypothetical protein